MFKNKKFLIAITLIIGSGLFAGCFGDGINESGRMFDTAKVNYKWEGAIQGEETVYISGEKTRSEINTVTKIGGVDTSQKRIILNDGNSIYKINTESNLALKEDSPYKARFAKLTPEEKHDLRKRLILLLDEGEDFPESTGEETIEGQTCQTYSVTGENSTCVWEGITLRNEVVIDGGKAKQKMTSLETDINLPEDLFKLPEDIKIQEIK